MRLNKYLAHCGIGTRRQADGLVRKGKVAINGVIVDNPALFVNPKDKVTYDGKEIHTIKENVYILMNKPKNFSCNYDVENNKSIAKILRPKIDNIVNVPVPLRKEDRGLILLTDDQEVIDKINQPNHNLKQVYELTLNKALEYKHLELLREEVTINNNIYKLQGIDYLANKEKNKIGVTSHHIDLDHLPQMFELFGYKIEILDRMYIAGLTKKDLPRGFFRLLNPKEVIFVKHFF